MENAEDRTLLRPRQFQLGSNMLCKIWHNTGKKVAKIQMAEKGPNHAGRTLAYTGGMKHDENPKLSLFLRRSRFCGKTKGKSIFFLCILLFPMSAV